jgi:hypothetical protein
MKLALLALATLVAGGIGVTTPPRPPFPPSAAKAPDAQRLVVVSSRAISPGLGRDTSCRVPGVPKTMRGLPMQRAICPGGTRFVLYGMDGASARVLLGVNEAGYIFDFKHYVWPPRNLPGEKAFVYEEIVWAREANGVLYVTNSHLTYAKSSYGQNAYVTAFDMKSKRRLWRSKALVANAQTFAVTPDYLVTGYGFTAEPDWLYLLDRRTGRVVERLSLPSAPEKITRRGKRFLVRTYDHVLTVELRGR